MKRKAHILTLFGSISELSSNLLFAVVYSLMNLTYKAILCLLRKQGLRDTFSAPIGGFLAGLWLIFDKSESRKMILNTVFIKMVIDCQLNRLFEDPDHPYPQLSHGESVPKVFVALSIWWIYSAMCTLTTSSYPQYTTEK